MPSKRQLLEPKPWRFLASQYPKFLVSVFQFDTAAPAKSPWRVLGQRPKRWVKTNAWGCSLGHYKIRAEVQQYARKTKGLQLLKKCTVKGLQNGKMMKNASWKNSRIFQGRHLNLRDSLVWSGTFFNHLRYLRSWFRRSHAWAGKDQSSAPWWARQ